MTLETASPQEDSIHNALMNILPEDGFNLGQSQETEDVAKPEVTTEVKTEVSEPAKVETAQPNEPDEVEIDYEGNRYKLPKELKDAFLREKDYRHKTMELAEQRKALGQADPKQVEEYKTKLTHYEQLLGNAVTADQKVDWVKLLESDPIEYLRQKELSESRAREWQQVSARNNTELAEKQRQALSHEREQLLAKQPEWKDEAKFEADRQKITKSLAEAGYKPEEINSIADHRALLIADKARRYDELMASKSEVVKKIEKLPPKVERPGVPSASEGQANKAAMSSLKKSGSIDDAAAALRSLMG